MGPWQYLTITFSVVVFLNLELLVSILTIFQHTIDVIPGKLLPIVRKNQTNIL